MSLISRCNDGLTVTSLNLVYAQIPFAKIIFLSTPLISSSYYLNLHIEIYSIIYFYLWSCVFL